METGLEIAFAIQLIVLGLAHLLRPEPMVQYYQHLQQQGEGGVFSLALLSLVTGSLVVAFHNVWTGWGVLLTIFGWCQLIKGTAYLLFPKFGLRQIRRVTPEKTKMFRLPGIPLLVIGLGLAWHVLAG